MRNLGFIDEEDSAESLKVGNKSRQVAMNGLRDEDQQSLYNNSKYK